MVTVGEGCHLGVACGLYALQLVWCVYLGLKTVEFRAHAAIALRGSVWVLILQTVCLETLAIPVMVWAILGYQASSGMCASYITVQQFCVSCGASSYVYRIAQISYKLSRLYQARQNAVIITAFDSISQFCGLETPRISDVNVTSENEIKIEVSCPEKKLRVYAANLIVWLLHNKIHIWALGFFIVNFFGIFWLSDVPLKLMVRGDLTFSECQSPAHALSLLLWYGYVLPYAIWLRICNFHDRFDVRGEIYWLTIIASILATSYVFVSVYGYCNYNSFIGCPHGPRVSNTHWVAFTILSIGLFNTGVCFSGMYLPLKVAMREYRSKRLSESSSVRSPYPPLYDVLIYRPTLIKFYEHVYSEWSPENLLFYLAATSFEMRWTERASTEPIDLNEVRSEALAIYTMFLTTNAEKQVNLSSEISREINSHFNTDTYWKLSYHPRRVHLQSLVLRSSDDPNERRLSVRRARLMGVRIAENKSRNPLTRTSVTQPETKESESDSSVQMKSLDTKRSSSTFPGKSVEAKGIRTPSTTRKSGTRSNSSAAALCASSNLSSKAVGGVNSNAVTVTRGPSPLSTLKRVPTPTLGSELNLSSVVNRQGSRHNPTAKSISLTKSLPFLPRSSSPRSSSLGCKLGFQRASSLGVQRTSVEGLRPKKPDENADSLRSLESRFSPNKLLSMASTDSPKASNVFLMRPRRRSSNPDFKIKNGSLEDFRKVLRIFTKARAAVLILMANDSYIRFVTKASPEVKKLLFQLNLILQSSP
ncbi:hypothetical protein AAMO2058_000430500 [Amorphochlora amoebiformis]